MRRPGPAGFPDINWLKDMAPLLKEISSNVKEICRYGFTEMVNNVIDHSGAKTLTTELTKITHKGKTLLLLYYLYPHHLSSEGPWPIRVLGLSNTSTVFCRRPPVLIRTDFFLARVTFSRGMRFVLYH